MLLFQTLLLAALAAGVAVNYSHWEVAHCKRWVPTTRHRVEHWGNEHAQTECACRKYKTAEDGLRKPVESCPDCAYDGHFCTSEYGRIDPRLFHFYARKCRCTVVEGAVKDDWPRITQNYPRTIDGGAADDDDDHHHHHHLHHHDAPLDEEEPHLARAVDEAEDSDDHDDHDHDAVAAQDEPSPGLAVAGPLFPRDEPLGRAIGGDGQSPWAVAENQRWYDRPGDITRKGQWEDHWIATECTCRMYRTGGQGGNNSPSAGKSKAPHYICPDCEFDGQFCTSRQRNISQYLYIYWGRERCFAPWVRGAKVDNWYRKWFNYHQRVPWGDNPKALHPHPVRAVAAIDAGPPPRKAVVGVRVKAGPARDTTNKDSGADANNNNNNNNNTNRPRSVAAPAAPPLERWSVASCQTYKPVLQRPGGENRPGTECACRMYQKNDGIDQNENLIGECKDCRFDGHYCVSPSTSIIPAAFSLYCSGLCDSDKQAKGSFIDTFRRRFWEDDPWQIGQWPRNGPEHWTDPPKNPPAQPWVRT